MSKTNHMLWATGLAIASSCLAQPAQDTAKANHDELAASVAANSSFLVQDEPTVKISGYMQFRYVINSRDDVPGGGEDTASGFQTRRTKINFSGAVSDNLSYKISGGFSRSSGSITLDDAYGKSVV